MDIVEAGSLGARAAEWDQFAATAPLPSPFLGSWWLENVQTQAARYVLVVDGNKLLGGLALEEHRRAGVRILRHVGQGPLAPDHLDLVAAPGHEAVVSDALRTWLASQGDVLVDLDGLAPESRLGAVVPGRANWRVSDRAPYAPLDGGFEDYLSNRPRIARTSTSRARVRLERDGVRFRVAPANEVERALGDFRRLHGERWADASCLGDLYAGFERAIEVGVRRGAARLNELVTPDAEIIATLVTCDAGGRRAFYQSGRSIDHQWRSAGTVLLARTIELACTDGCREIDLLRGQESYKKWWADADREVLAVRSASGPASALYDRAGRARRAFRARRPRVRAS